MKKIEVIELFAGIAGFSYGLEMTKKFKTVLFCELDKYCQKVIRKNYPGVEIHSNVTNLKYKKNVGLATAGFPCQDMSLAGDGAGITGERSGLFWYILRTLCMVGRPPVLLENVAALLTRGLCTVLGALASFGYDAEWHCIPASYVGAWHERDRAWIFAHSNQVDAQGRSQEPIFRQSDLSRKLTRSFEEWPGRSNLPTSRFCRKDDGVSKRMDRTNGPGNAIVPQIAEIWGHVISERFFK